MNHCRDCNSDYAMPGSCNCFAPGGKRSIASPTITPAPYVPLPWTPLPMPYVPGTLTVPFTIGPCSICGKYGCKDMHIVLTSTVSAAEGAC